MQVELINMYINVGGDNGSEKYWAQKNPAISGKLIKAVFASYVYVYIFCTSSSEYEMAYGKTDTFVATN